MCKSHFQWVSTKCFFFSVGLFPYPLLSEQVSTDSFPPFPQISAPHSPADTKPHCVGQWASRDAFHPCSPHLCLQFCCLLWCQEMMSCPCPAVEFGDSDLSSEHPCPAASQDGSGQGRDGNLLSLGNIVLKTGLFLIITALAREGLLPAICHQPAAHPLCL